MYHKYHKSHKYHKYNGLLTKYHGLLTLLVIFGITLLITSITSCQRGGSPDSEKGGASEPVRKALAWVSQHPANFHDGMFVEIAEEIVTFYILNRYTKDQSEKDHYLKEIKNRLDLIASNREIRAQSNEYTMFLAITEVAQKLGLKVPELKKIIESQLIPNPLLYPSHMTSRIWNTVYLKRLGYTPSATLEESMPQSTLAQEVNQKLLLQYTKAKFNQMYVDPMATTIYDMTHEIFALTDFGELPPPSIIAGNQAYFSTLFDQAIDWAITATHEDVLAELIMCVKILDLKNVSSMQRGINYVISRQEKDGSFGLTNPGRANMYRHGILVSIMALTMCGE